MVRLRDLANGALVILHALGGVNTACAQLPRPTLRTPYRAQRADEDYRYLRKAGDTSAFDRDVWDRFKYIALNPVPAFVSLGGELRAQFERNRHPGFGRGVPDADGYLLGRALLHADWHFGGHTRLFLQGATALERGRAGGPRPTDENRADLQQAFVEVGHAQSKLRARVGRQELTFGSGRLFSVRDPSNVRRTFDAVRLTTRHRTLTIDGIIARVVAPRRGVWDDQSSSADQVAGAYGTVLVERQLNGGIDAYWLHRVLASATYARGAAPERRHTVGMRIWGRSAGWDHNTEVLVQRGRFGSIPIRAAVVSTDIGYTWEEVRAWPRLALRVARSTGDADTASGVLRAVNPLFPRGFVFGSPLGPVNLTNVHPTLDLQLTRRLSLFVDYDAFWRTRAGDGVYDAGGALVTPARGTSARSIGQQMWLQLDYFATRHVRVNAGLARFVPGRVLRDAVRAPRTTVAVVATQYTF
jgi:hypothetical protein